MPKKLRSAGADWRLLVHEPRGKSHDVRSGPYKGEPSEHEERHPIPGTEFDELVVGQWMRAEQMDTGAWWILIAGININIRVDRDGRPRRVLLEGPNDNYGAVEGVEYELVWNGHQDRFTGVADQ
jgi:hypothetical protein